MKTYTPLGFKRSVNNENPLLPGHDRAFIVCLRCKTASWYDFVPYSLSNPIRTTPCGHFFKEYITLRNHMKITNVKATKIKRK